MTELECNRSTAQTKGEIRFIKGAIEQIISDLEQESVLPETLRNRIIYRQEAIDEALNGIEKGVIIGDEIQSTLNEIARIEKLTPEELWEEAKAEMRELGWELADLEKEDFNETM